MGVLADDRGDRARARQPPSERQLECVRGMPVLRAPVQVHDHDAGAGAARAAGVTQDSPGARDVHRPSVRQRDPIRHLRIGEQGHAYAPRLQQERASPLSARGERAGGRTPARANARRVASIPAWPRSSEWFEAVLHASKPVASTARAIAGGELNTGYPAGGAAVSGVSMWQNESELRRTQRRIGRSSGRKSYPRPPASACARATIGRCGSRSPLTPIVSRTARGGPDDGGGRRRR